MITRNFDFKIRDAESKDLSSVHQIFDEVLVSSTATFEEEPYSLKDWTEIFEAKKNAGIPFIVAESAGTVIGYGTFGAFRRASGYRISVEHSLHVAKDCRGKGVGKQILRELIRRAISLELENMIAAIDGENQTSIHFHEKMGFVKVASIENIARKFSKDLTLVLMQLRLRTHG